MCKFWEEQNLILNSFNTLNLSYWTFTPLILKAELQVIWTRDKHEQPLASGLKLIEISHLANDVRKSVGINCLLVCTNLECRFSVAEGISSSRRKLFKLFLTYWEDWWLLVLHLAGPVEFSQKPFAQKFLLSKKLSRGAKTTNIFTTSFVTFLQNVFVANHFYGN